MTSITTRAGKGSPLTHNEVDANFTNLNNDKLDTAGIALGSAASPTLKFTGDPNTGIYSPGADQLALSTAGNGRLFIDGTGFVGIGTVPAVGYGLDVRGLTRILSLGSASGLEIGTGTATNQFASVDLVGDATYTDYGLRLLRGNSGANADSSIIHKGTGGLSLVTEEAAPIVLATSNTERLRITSAGLVGIGTSSPTFNLVSANNTTDGGWLYSSGTVSTLGLGGYSLAGDGAFQLKYDRSTGAITFNGGSRDTSVERARIDNSGRLLVGTSTARSNFFNTTITANILLENDNAVLGVVRNGNNAFSSYLILAKSRSSSNTIVQANDQLGSVNFQGNDGTEFVEAAQISAFVDGTPGANDMPGRLVFSVTADGAASPTEALRIKSTRIVNIANTPVHADNAAAKTAGLVDGDVYRKSDGTMMIVFT